jgi:uncharacterized repeat protein (TIGR03806 family)
MNFDHRPFIVALIVWLACLAALASDPANQLCAQAPDVTRSASDFGNVPAGTEHPIQALRENWQNVESKVVGQPDPPLPYRVVPTMPALHLNQMIFAVVEPGTDELLILDEASNEKSRLVRTIDRGKDGKVEQLLEFGPDIIYALEFHPQFAENGWFYVTTNGPGGPEGDDEKHCRVLRYQLERDGERQVVENSKKVILEWASNGHNGCGIVFGPDGMLYITTGDGTSDSDTNLTGQGLDHLLAKLLRIDVDHPSGDRPYGVPQDNPFVGQANVRPETWAYGFRNPWRMSVDAMTGDIWVGNNGQDLWEQAYLVRRGANYGWSVYEGSHPFYANRKQGPTEVSPPTFEHPHSESRSLTGGVVYYGSKYPELRGGYVYGDHSTGKIWAGKVDKQGTVLWHREIADTTLGIAGFTVDRDGEILIIDYQGKGKSGFFQFVPNETTGNHEAFPKRLSETGLFVPGKGHTVVPGVIPYSVNSPLWSDGAKKERFAYIPAIAATNKADRIKIVNQRSWNFPDGTVLIKSFGLPVHTNGESKNQWIETRLLTRLAGEWIGYSYRWNDEQTDATLVTKEGDDAAFKIDRAALDRKTRNLDGDRPDLESLTWRFPSRSECMVCHSRAANFVLGVSTGQLNRDHDFGHSIVANQLEIWQFLGAAEVEKKKDKQDQVEVFTPDQLADPYDDTFPIEKRARAYLHSNCAQCHVGAGGGNSQFNVAFHTSTKDTKLIGVAPLHDRFGLQDAQLVVAGEPDRSVLIHRMKIRGRGQMPQLATNRVDEEAVKMLSKWIRQLK